MSNLPQPDNSATAISSPSVEGLYALRHRRRAREELRDQLSRIVALTGALLINLTLMFRGMLWPTFMLPLSPRDEIMDVLELRFIDKSLPQAQSLREFSPSAFVETNRVTNATVIAGRVSRAKHTFPLSELATPGTEAPLFDPSDAGRETRVVTKLLASTQQRSAMSIWEAKGSHGHERVASYIQVRPHEGMDVMARTQGHINYQSTRFDRAWTSRGESSVDTVVRRAVEGTTIRWTIALPRGLRIDCAGGPGTPDSAMSALPLLSFGCHGDPPPPPVASDAVVKIQTMAPAKPLAENPPPEVETAVAAAPITFDNAALCATARVAHAPPSSGCEVNVQAVPPRPKAGNSWLPARDPAAIKNSDAKRK